MKAVRKTCLACAIAATVLAGKADAQQVPFGDYRLESGTDLQAGASYRFSNVTPDLDAVVTVDALSNTRILHLDATRENGTADAGWLPVLGGTGDPAGMHVADFTLRFYTNGTNELRSLDELSTTVFSNGSSKPSGSFSMEFAHIEGASRENNALMPSGDAILLSRWKIQNAPGYSIRYGWQGGAPTREFNNLMEYNGGSNGMHTYETQNFPPMLQTASNIATVPEPSVSFLLVLPILPLCLYRGRKVPN